MKLNLALRYIKLIMLLSKERYNRAYMTTL